MSTIKSALELALERTNDIKADKKSLDEQKFNEQGMKLFARLEKREAKEVQEHIDSLHKDEAAPVLQGLLKVLLSRISLPSSQASLDSLPVMADAISILFPKQKALAGLTDQLKQLYEGYLADKTRIVDSLKERFEPQLRQKEDQMAQQTGQRMKLHAENEPEFAKALQANFEQLDAQYGQVIDQAKSELEEKFNQG